MFLINALVHLPSPPSPDLEILPSESSSSVHVKHGGAIPSACEHVRSPDLYDSIGNL